MLHCSIISQPVQLLHNHGACTKPNGVPLATVNSVQNLQRLGTLHHMQNVCLKLLDVAISWKTVCGTGHKFDTHCSYLLGVWCGLLCVAFAARLEVYVIL